MAKSRVNVTALTAEVTMLGVVGGVDTHGRAQVAAAVDQLGRLLGTRSFAATAAGYRALQGWLVGFGALVAVGVEGTGSYGAGLARALSAAGVEVDRPDRCARRRAGKDDGLDAISACRRSRLAWPSTCAANVRDRGTHHDLDTALSREGAVR